MRINIYEYCLTNIVNLLNVYVSVTPVAILRKMSRKEYI
jgi:hypothetical protein